MAWPVEIEAQLRREAAELDLFDASAWLGRTPAFPLMAEGTPELIADLHRRVGINGVLLSHWNAAEDCSQEPNQQLLQAVAGRDNWYAALAMQPLFPADPGVPAVNGADWSRKARAVRVFPASWHYALVDWCVGSLCEMLIEKRLPLFVLHTETTFQDLYDLAQRYPELVIVVEGQAQKILYHTRMVLPLMKACPNLHLEMSNYCTQGLIAYTVNELGAERLIFASFAPARDPLVPLGLLLQADITTEAKRAIAGANIRRMISEVRP
ncbi:MAG TPA: amidohydrolase family protein [Armatimonadota bacterium]|nr:amidohydrolase family protein [Armatimonadota bacterium]